jgi:hypothetical protein
MHLNYVGIASFCLPNINRGPETQKSTIVTSAVRLAHLPTAPKDHSAQNNLSTPNTIYMPKAAMVRFTFRTPLITTIKTRSMLVSNCLLQLDKSWVGGNSFKYQGGMAVIKISLGGISVRNSFLGGIAVICRY